MDLLKTHKSTKEEKSQNLGIQSRIFSRIRLSGVKGNCVKINIKLVIMLPLLSPACLIDRLQDQHPIEASKT